MLYVDWNWDDALAVRYGEGLEYGLERGREEGLTKGREDGRQKQQQEIARKLKHCGVELGP
jgi:flagellar biosynthesis/type III secretory pathway protein FliH